MRSHQQNETRGTGRQHGAVRGNTSPSPERTLAKMKEHLPIESLNAAVAILRPAFPTLTNQELLSKLLEDKMPPKSSLSYAGTRLISVKEAALVLSCSKPTVWRLIRAQKLKAIHLGGLTRITETELNKLIFQQTGNCI